MAPVTIRQAKWFSSLYSIVLKLIKKHYAEATIALELYQLLVSDFQDSARFEKERAIPRCHRRSACRRDKEAHRNIRIEVVALDVHRSIEKSSRYELCGLQAGATDDAIAGPEIISDPFFLGQQALDFVRSPGDVVGSGEDPAISEQSGVCHIILSLSVRMFPGSLGRTCVRLGYLP